MEDKGMSDKEFERINKEIEEWNKLKKDIKEKAGLISVDNYDKDSIIFSILGLKDKKEKKKFIKVLIGFQENTFISTFNAMHDYFEKTLRKDYVFIEDISVFKNMFGMIKDRTKSWKEEIKSVEKKIIETKKKIVKSKDYDEQSNLKFSLYGCDNRIKESSARVRILEDLYRQLKFDIKNLEKTATINKTSKLKRSKIVPSMLTDGEGGYYPDDKLITGTVQNTNKMAFDGRNAIKEASP